MLSLASSTLKFAASAIRLGHHSSSAQQAQQQQPSSKLAEYSLEEVSWHDSRHDCWIVLHDRIYDVTSLVNGVRWHPGGLDVIMEHAGRDCTMAFKSVGHSIDALEQTEEYLVGILPMRERIYIRP